VKRLAQGRLMESRGRVVDGEDHEAVGRLPWLAVDAGDRLTGEELSHRVAAQGHDHARLEHLEVAPEPHVAGRNFLGQRVAVLGRPVAHDIGDENLAAVEPNAGEELVEELAGGADERLPLEVFVVPRRLAQEEDAGVRRAIPGDGLARAPVERAGCAGADLVGDLPQLRERGVLHRGDYAAAEGFRGAFRAR